MSDKPSAGFRTVETLIGGDPLPGCLVCGGKLVMIRNRYPGMSPRNVCPQCLQERMDIIRDASSPDYGIACTANAALTGGEAYPATEGE